MSETPAPSDSEMAGGEDAETEAKKPRKLKKKDMQAILEMDMKFKKVGFEQALTAEEKAAKKAARLAEKKKKKKKGTKEVGAEARMEETGTETREESGREGEKKAEKEDEAGEKKKKVQIAEREDEAGGEKKKKMKKAKKIEGDEAGEKKAKKGKKAKGEEGERGEETGEKKTEEEGGKSEKKREGKKKGKKKAHEAEPTAEEEGGGGGEGGKGKKKKGKKTTAPSEAPAATEEEGGEVIEDDEKTKKQKKKKKEETIGEPSGSTVVYRTPSEADEMRMKKAGKTEKQVRLQVKDKIVKERSSKKSIASTASWSTSGSFGTLASSEASAGSVSSSSEDDLVKKPAGKKRKKADKKRKKFAEELPPEAKAVTEKKGARSKEEQEEEKPEEKKKKKKKKKEEEPEETDIMAEIRRMKAQAAPKEVVEEEVTMPPPEEKKKAKEGPKKKLSKKQRALLAQEQAEKARIQAELEAQRLIEEEKKRVQEERKMAKERDKRETAEQALRNEQLAFSTGLIEAVLERNRKINDEEKKDSEWAQYLKCDGLPDPIDPPQMNTYLHLWEQVIDDVTVDEVVRRTNEVLKLLETLQDYIDDPFDASQSLVEDWKWIRGLCRDHQNETLNMATYRLLRDVDSRLNRIDIPTADFNIADKDFNLCLYVLVQLPTPMYNPRNVSKKKLEINFADIKMRMAYPLSIDAKYMATRAMYLRFDHLSDTCDTYDPIAIPDAYETNLLESTSREWYEQMLYKYEHRKRPEKKTIEDESGDLVEIEPPPEPELVEGELPPAVPFQILDPSASQYVVELEDEVYAKHREGDTLEMYVGENAVNLRKFMIIGGIYCLELFYQPPQPRDMVAFEVRLTTLKLPKRLEEVPVHIRYVPPPPEDPLVQKTPEELEQDVKKQEEVLDSLVSVTVTLPEHVMFLDLPVVCQWDDERKVWTTQDVVDLKHIEEQNYITFRTGLFGPFALAVNRYLNFPFQMWEIKPETDGTVTFQLTCAILMIEFNVKGNAICMTQLQNSPNNALQDVIGVYFKLPKLMRILRDGGVDVFPAYDAFKYVEGVCEKQWPMEKHTYYSMGLLSCVFNFSFSRWNNQAGRRRLVMQMREYHPEKTKQKTHSMLLVSPLHAVYVDCTEVTPAFNETPVPNMKFCSDLFHLMKATCSITTRNRVLNGPQDVAKALADVLIATRIFSFS